MPEYKEEPMEIEIGVILQQEITTRSEIRHSQWRTFVALFSSTFLLLWWVQGVAPERMLPVFRALLAVPVFMNMIAWLLWGFFVYLSLLRAGIRIPVGENRAHDDRWVRQILDSYQYARFSLGRQLRSERLIGLAIVVQAIFIGVSLLYVSISRSSGFSSSSFSS
jgi:hypothetical protein